LRALNAIIAQRMTSCASSTSPNAMASMLLQGDMTKVFFYKYDMRGSFNYCIIVLVSFLLFCHFVFIFYLIPHSQESLVPMWTTAPFPGG
jgi:hypothetical protein